MLAGKSPCGQDRLPAAMKPPLSPKPQDRAGAVGLQAAVIQMERVGDHAGGEVGVPVQRLAVHDGARVALRMAPERHRHLRQVLAAGAVEVHVPPGGQRRHLRGREQPERVEEGAEGRPVAGLAVAFVLALADGAVHHGVAAQPGGDGHRRVHHGGHAAAAAAAPHDGGMAQLRDAQRRLHEHGLVPLEPKGGEAVHLVQWHAGVLRRALHGRQAQAQLRALVQRATLAIGGLAHADDRGLAGDALAVTHRTTPHASARSAAGTARPRSGPIRAAPASRSRGPRWPRA